MLGDVQGSTMYQMLHNQDWQSLISECTTNQNEANELQLFRLIIESYTHGFLLVFQCNPQNFLPFSASDADD